MLHVDHSRQAQSPGSSLPGTRVAAHGKRAAPLLARFLLTAQGAGASGLFSQPRVRHGVEDVDTVTIIADRAQKFKTEKLNEDLYYVYIKYSPSSNVHVFSVAMAL